jgi:agmatine deiminase
MRRRTLVKSLLAAGALHPVAQSTYAAMWSAPAEEHRHSATWMAWPHNQSIYGDLWYFESVQEHLGRLARAISRFEPVFMAATPADFPRLRALCGDRVQPVAIATNDMWMRDSGPVFVTAADGSLGAIDFNFNGWGKKQEPRDSDALVARRLCEHLKIPVMNTPLVGEGGGLE